MRSRRGGAAAAAALAALGLSSLAGAARGRSCNESAPADALAPGGPFGEVAPSYFEAILAAANVSGEVGESFRNTFYKVFTQAEKRLTLFAPTDAALEGGALPEGREAAAGALAFSGVYWAPLQEWEEGKTTAGEDAGTLRIRDLGGNATVEGPCNSAAVLETFEFCDGSTVIHVLDALLLPAPACAEPTCESEGADPEAGDCCDRQPGDYPCRQEKEWGKCEEDYMARDGWCARTCGFCAPPVRAAAGGG